MADLIKVIAVFLLIAFIPHIIIAIGIYVVAIYGIVGGFYLLKSLFSGDSSGGGGSHEPDPGDYWQGTGNPYV